MDWRLLAGDARVVAPRLLGSLLERELDGQVLQARIVETEAYDQTDAASHSYRGPTPRNQVMFGPPGHLYVYFSYGRHYCMNVVCGPVGAGAAVLIRAVEPLEGQTIMEQHRAGHSGRELTNGPAKVCQALGVDIALTGHDLQTAPLRLSLQPPLRPEQIVQATRIGISRATDKPWRFYERGNDYVSRPA